MNSINLNHINIDDLPVLYRFQVERDEFNQALSAAFLSLQEKIEGQGVEFLFLDQYLRVPGDSDQMGVCVMLYPASDTLEKGDLLLKSDAGLSYLVEACWKETRDYHGGGPGQFIQAQGHIFLGILRYHHIQLERLLLEARSRQWEGQLKSEWSDATVSVDAPPNNPVQKPRL